MRNGKYSIYKGMSGKFGALQLSLIPPCYSCSSCREKNYNSWEHVEKKDCKERMEYKSGSVLLEFAPTVDKNKYDWSNKIIFAIDVSEIGNILNGIMSNQEVSLLHDPGAQSKNRGKVLKKLVLTPGKEGGFLLNINETNGDNKKNCFIPLAPGEVTVLETIFRNSVVKLIGLE